MNILFFILAMAVFQPSTVQAETVFDDLETFQIAKAVKLGRMRANITAGSQKKLAVSQNSVDMKGKASGQKYCPSNQLDTGTCTTDPKGVTTCSGNCASCPTGGICNGTATLMCKSGYRRGYKYYNGSSWVNDNPTFASKCLKCDSDTACSGGPSYYCNKRGGWKTTNHHKQPLKTAAADWCVDCETYYECDGTEDRYCKGRNAGTFSKDNAYSPSGGAKNSNDCVACPDTNAYCNGTKTFLCYRNTQGWVAGSSTKNTGWHGTDETTCHDCTEQNRGKYVLECDGIRKKCRGYNYDSNDGGSYGSNNAFATYNGTLNTMKTTAKNGTGCWGCPSNATCNGLKFKCNDGYFITNETVSASSSCSSVSANTSCPNNYEKVAVDNGNTVYCVQKVS